MDEAEIPHAIELLVGLLGLAAFVAIVARPAISVEEVIVTPPAGVL